MDPVLTERMVRAAHRLTLVMTNGQPRDPVAASLPHTWRRCLLFIDDTPGITPSRLAADLGVTPAAVSPLLRRLEADVLVVRTSDPHDGRSVRLALTPAARTIVASLREQVDAQVANLLSPLSAAEGRQLIELLERSLRLEHSN